MIIIDICYKACCMETQTVALTLTFFQGIKRFIIYIYSHPHKPIFYSSNVTVIFHLRLMTNTSTKVNTGSTFNL